jgi:hypothetical protein
LLAAAETILRWVEASGWLCKLVVLGGRVDLSF